MPDWNTWQLAGLISLAALLACLRTPVGVMP